VYRAISPRLAGLRSLSGWCLQRQAVAGSAAIRPSQFVRSGRERGAHVADLLFVALTIVAFALVVGVLRGVARL
jgi:hypothetical protein